MKTYIKSLIAVFALSTLFAFEANAEDKESKKSAAFGTGIYMMKSGNINLSVEKFNDKQTVIQLENEKGEILYREVTGKRVTKFRRSLDISTLPAGNYTIEVTSDGQTQSKNLELHEKKAERMISLK
ncbi:T9SS type A sorting domain-containing protein [Dyadobacter sp. CY312]|uniref:T9SS type A sorting domain-containing protein n=1 Tax=Dyadobacter sp. CY312 TaxID=2907303 RepID=UPI001F24A5C6|nr:T9SS type A sorting domain-containing protein [Dyadobacter sp. CY312]MCE7039933.1 T9SS type A sorting domain-containing protein [Dyadobacter sp. CY312]